jgi:hypothetical protein
MPFNEKRAASIKDSLLDMLLGDPSTRHLRPNPTATLLNNGMALAAGGQGSSGAA